MSIVQVADAPARYTPPHAFRDGEAGDRGYIIDTWLQTYRRSPFASKLPDFAYWSRFGHVGVVEAMVDAGRLLVCTLPEGGSWMYGWLCCDGLGALHYLFVRDEFRGQGMGRALLNHFGFGDGRLVVTHLTTDFSRGLGRGRDVRFVNPYRKAA